MKESHGKTKPVSLKIVGLILSESYQRSRIFVERLHKHHRKKFLSPKITGMLDMDWTDYIQKLRKKIGSKTWAVKSVVVFLNESFLGGEEELFSHFKHYTYKTLSPEKIKEEAEKEYVKYLNKGNLIYTYMELSLGGQYMGSLLFQLRYDILPNSSLWFTEFCTHDKFTYRGSKIHRVCKQGWFQSGELRCQSKWPLRSLVDENYSYKHDRRGILSFANIGKHTSQFQFFVTFEAADWMDGNYVAFGRVVEGSDVLRRIECTPCTYERPDRDIVITNCGLAKVGLGRAIDPNLRLKGITIGQPHLHLEFFINLIFEQFNRILFDRLDEEGKKLIDGSWTVEMIWENLLVALSTQKPLENILDDRDKSSQTFIAERYIAGLYSLPDYPDHFIKSLLDEVVQKAIENSDILRIARSVVDLLLKLSLDKSTLREQIPQDIEFSLTKDVPKIVFSSEHSRDRGSAITGIKTAFSEVSNFKEPLSDLRKRAGISEEEDVLPFKDQLSAKESVVAFIWGLLLDILKN